ncbi:MAG: radical SAM protein [Anaerolineales bacterium]
MPKRPRALGPDFALAQSPPACYVPPGDAVRPATSGLPDKKVSLGIYSAATPTGRPMRMLKTLLTSACERNCFYCPFRAGRNYRRATFKPDEMAQTFAGMHRTGVVDGLFLSSGIIKGGMATQDRLLDTADILRNRQGFRGYLHLKIMPGAEREQVLRAMQLADRISINLEAPNTERLRRLAPKKQFIEELLQPLRWADEIRRTHPAHNAWNGRWPSTVTQFVVGGVGETDLEHLTTTHYLYRQLHLARTYFSAFSPVPDTPMDSLPPVDPLREHRLYQASFLLRDYGFDLEELPFVEGGNLPLGEDPKQVWAQMNLSETPVELNRASRRELLRVPGIGPRSARAIMAARRRGALREVSALHRLGVRGDRFVPFVLLAGRRPAQQQRLF